MSIAEPNWLVRILLVWPLLLAVAAVAEAEQAEHTVRYVGYAYDRDSGELLYRETHTQRLLEGRPASLETVYQDADGEVFARRQVAYGDTPSQPEYEFVDNRMNYAEGSRLEQGRRVVYKRGPAGEEQAPVKIGRRPLVIDAGFDRFILDRWDELKNGKALKFDFLNAHRLEAIAFRLRRLGERQTDSGPVTDFKMEINNFFLRMFLGPIEISYLNEDKSLYRYQGISNIKKPGGRNYVVRIEYPRGDREQASGSALKQVDVAPPDAAPVQ